MHLFPNEKKLLASNEDKVILTDHRIQMNDRSFGKSYTVAIFLEDVSSLEVKYKSVILFLMLAILCGVICVLAGGSGTSEGKQIILPALFFTVLFYFLWRRSRRHMIVVSSDGGSKLNFLAENMSSESIDDFIYKVSLAKKERVDKLSQTREFGFMAGQQETSSLKY